MDEKNSFDKVCSQFQSDKKKEIDVRHLKMPLPMQTITVSAGLLLAINLKYQFFTRNHMEILKIHAHLGLAGWFLQLIVGVSSKLIPMFLLGRSEKTNLLTYSFIFLNVGLVLFIAVLYFLGYSNRIIIYLLLEIAGVFCWIYFLADNFKNRMIKKTFSSR